MGMKIVSVRLETLIAAGGFTTILSARQPGSLVLNLGRLGRAAGGGGNRPVPCKNRI